MMLVDRRHAPCIEEDESYEDVDTSLLSEPEAKLKAADLDLVQDIEQEDAEAKGNGEPNS